MLEKIRQDDGAYAQKTMENFEVSITTVKRYLKECVEQKSSFRMRIKNVDIA